MNYWDSVGRWINTLLVFIVGVLAFDALFRLLEANEDNVIVAFVRVLSVVFLVPFQGMFGDQDYVLTTLVGVLGYALLAGIALGVLRSLQASLSQPAPPVRPEPPDERVTDAEPAVDQEGSDRPQAVTSDGDEIMADTVVVGIGIAPRTELAAAAGLTIENGVAVDAGFRTSEPDIYAAGDVAAIENQLVGARVRVEHWANALDGGPAAARSMMGKDVSWDRLPYFFTDQYDLGMEYTGHAPPGSYDDVVLRGDVPGRAFQAFWLSAGRPIAGMHVNMWDDGIGPLEELVKSGRTVDPTRLTDPEVPLREA